ncbi:MAG: DNA translocase FtsK, partial [Lachnospiraceae bacterium]|nr:DNA translocase FtsK [Lachnospiraceae bacterium]
KNPADSSYKIGKNDNDILRPPRKKKPKKYRFPLQNFLSRSEKKENNIDPQLEEKAAILVETLKQFGVGAQVTNITVGPSVTRFELKPDLGVKVSKILSLEDDVKLALAATEIRIEAPIPGKSAIGIEIANIESTGVMLGDIISSSEFRNAPSKLTVAIGKDIQGKVIVTDLRKMPHLLIAGATGSGKSVCINSLITSLIYISSPDDVRLIMVDPKVVELQIYDGIPHLLIPVVTNPMKAAAALNWAVSEMTRRYNLIQEKRVRDIESYNQAIQGDIEKLTINENNEADTETVKKLPYIVIIIDEFADLMMVASKDVENSIMRIAQLARACGIYLVIATQRPSVNVISGSIKTNVPSRISFAVSSERNKSNVSAN